MLSVAHRFRILIFLIVVLFSSCIANKNSCKLKNEKIYLKIDHISDERDANVLASIIPGKADSEHKSRGLAFALPYIFKLTLNETLKLINKDKEKYIATYTSDASDDLFYTSTESDADINIKNIRIIRTIKSEQSDKDTAIVISLGIEQSNDGYFLRLYTKDIHVKYTKAKLKFNDKTVDIKLQLNIQAFWFDGNKEHCSQEIANISFIYTDIQFNNKLPDDEREKYKSPWFPALPRTAFNTNQFGRGNYLLNMKVTEYDQLSKRTIIDPENKHMKEQGDILNKLLQGTGRN